MKKMAELPVKKVMQGIDGQYLHGQSMTLGEVTIVKGTVMPVHRHPHEQITYMLEGELQMECGGQQYTLVPGTVLLIPSDTPHGAVAITDCRLIDVFSPVREDYIVHKD